MALRKKAKTGARPGRPAIANRRLRLQRTGLHEETTGRLRGLIVRGDLAPGKPWWKRICRRHSASPARHCARR